MSPEKQGFFASAQNDAEKDVPAEDWAALDRELAQMAQETPKMPDDFHARWTEQVRAEARQAQRKARTESRRQWRYILSAAAVFIFLIGGTLLTRSRRTNDLTVNSAAAPRETAAPTAGNMETNIAEDYAAGVTAEGAGTAVLADMAQEEPETAEQEVGAAPEGDWFAQLFRKEESSAAKEGAAAYAVNGAAPAYDAAEEAAEADTYAAPEEAETAEEPMAAKGAAKSANAANSAAVKPTAAPTAVPAPEPTAAPTAEPAPEPAAAGPASEPETRESPFVSFLKDLGIFTLKTLGVAACAAVPAFAIGMIRRKRGKK